jgi:hypothetical protein
MRNEECGSLPENIRRTTRPAGTRFGIEDWMDYGARKASPKPFLPGFSWLFATSH